MKSPPPSHSSALSMPIAAITRWSSGSPTLNKWSSLALAKHTRNDYSWRGIGLEKQWREGLRRRAISLGSIPTGGLDEDGIAQLRLGRQASPPLPSATSFRHNFVALLRSKKSLVQGSFRALALSLVLLWLGVLSAAVMIQLEYIITRME